MSSTIRRPDSVDHSAVERSIELLLECARIAPDLNRVKAALSGDLDWTVTHELAWEHGLVPILCGILEESGAGVLVPVAERAALKAALIRSAQRGLSLTGELLRVVNEFHAHGLAVMPYKGPILAALLYDPPSRRQFGDLDILVRARDVTGAIAILRRLGYVPTIALTDAGQNELVRSRHELAFRHPTHGIILELQWTVAPRYFSLPLDVDDLWQRHSVISIRGTRSASLATEDLLFVLCIHGIRHIWQRLSWIRDVAQLITVSPELDWQRVRRVAADRGGSRILALGLYLASEWGGAILPSEVQQWVSRDEEVPALSREILQRIKRNEPSAPDLFAIGWFVVRSRERWRDRLRYSARLALDLGSADLEHLAAGRSVRLQYLLRPFRLSRKYGRALLRRRS